MELLKEDVEQYFDDPKMRCYLIKKGKQINSLFVEEWYTGKAFLKRFPNCTYESMEKELKKKNLRYHPGIINFIKGGVIIKENVAPTIRQLNYLRKSQLIANSPSKDELFKNEESKEKESLISNKINENNIGSLLLINHKKDGSLEQIEYTGFMVNTYKDKTYLHIALD